MSDDARKTHITDSRVDPRVEPPSVPPRPRSRQDTPVEGSSKRPPVPEGGKVYQPHYSAKVTKQIQAPDAFAAIQDLRSSLERRWKLDDKWKRESDERISELERGQGRVSQNDLGQQKALAEALVRVKKIEDTLPAKTAEAVTEANRAQTLDLKSSKLTEYLRLLGVVIGTAIASYFASYRGSSEADQGRKPTIVNVQPTSPSAPPANGLESQ